MVFEITKIVTFSLLWFVPIPLSVEEVVLWACGYPSCVEVIVVEFGLVPYSSCVEVILFELWRCAYPSCVEVIVVEF